MRSLLSYTLRNYAQRKSTRQSLVITNHILCDSGEGNFFRVNCFRHQYDDNDAFLFYSKMYYTYAPHNVNKGIVFIPRLNRIFSHAFKVCVGYADTSKYTLSIHNGGRYNLRRDEI